MNAPQQGSGGDDKDKAPPSTSPGNEGARGSRGQANDGARRGDNADLSDHAPVSGEPDLRRDGGQGGGGVASESSRSK